jgi:hypothetical protein
MSDQPSIIRHESEHSVSFPEGSQVATSKPSDPQGPQVRKTLAGEDAESPDGSAYVEAGLPPPFVKEPTEQPAAVVFERTVPASVAEAAPLPGQAQSEPAAAAPGAMARGPRARWQPGGTTPVQLPWIIICDCQAQPPLVPLFPEQTLPPSISAPLHAALLQHRPSLMQVPLQLDH